MTDFERRQPYDVFISAGRKAFLMAVHIQNNPYREKPFRDLWEKGYRQAKRRYEQGLPSNPFTEIRPKRHKSFYKKSNYRQFKRGDKK